MWRSLVAAIAWAACVQASLAEEASKAVNPAEMPRYEAEVIVIDEVPRGVVVPRALWRFGTFTAGSIPVCWEVADPQSIEERDWVRAAITNTWQRHSGLTFGGWGQCSTTFQGIRIEVVDEADSPRVERFGMRLKGLRNGMELNFRFVRFQAECCSRPWPFDDCTLEQNRRACIEATAIHEFGHALGFVHEQRHPDTPESCEYREGLGVGEVVVTAQYDPMSVMNYCRSDRMRAVQLSDSDIRTLQELYCTPGVRTCGGYRVGLRID